MPDYVTSDEIPERTADHHIGRKVLACGDAAGADRSRKAVGTKFSQPSRILGGDDPRQSPTGGCMAGGERAVERVIACSVRPKPSCSNAFIRAFPVGCELQAPGDERSISHSLRPEEPGFLQMIVVLQRS